MDGGVPLVRSPHRPYPLKDLTMKECLCCKQQTNNFGVNKVLCRSCNLLKSKTRFLRFGYGTRGHKKGVILNPSPAQIGYRTVCPTCSVEFLSHNKARTYCSIQCSDRRHRRGYKFVYRTRYPDKYRAQKILEHAVHSGRIHRPNICESCLNIGPTEGHHPDYTRPIFVYWWCHNCHAEHHRKERSGTPPLNPPPIKTDEGPNMTPFFS